MIFGCTTTYEIREHIRHAAESIPVVAVEPFYRMPRTMIPAPVRRVKIWDYG